MTFSCDEIFCGQLTQNISQLDDGQCLSNSKVECKTLCGQVNNSRFGIPYVKLLSTVLHAHVQSVMSG